MDQALSEARRLLGRDAVILHTREVKRGGVMGIGRKTLVEITAADGVDIARNRGSSRTRNRAAQRAAVAHPIEEQTSAGPAPRPSRALRDHPTAGDLIRRTYQVAKSEQDQPTSPVESPSYSNAVPNQAINHAQAPAPETAGLANLAQANPTTVTQTPAPGQDLSKLTEELREMRNLVARAVHYGPGPASIGLAENDPLVEHYSRLIEQEVTQELANQLILDAKTLTNAGASAANGQASSDEPSHRQQMIQAIASHIPVTGEESELPRSPDGRPHVVALIGPTGVGKTTTVAKLAANFKLRRKLNVALITLDTYRIAAVEQLKTYAGIIGLPLHVASSPEQVAQAMDKCLHADVVIVDTAGRSPRDDRRLQELQTLLEVAKPHVTHLVLSATHGQSVLNQAVERFSAVSYDSMIFTKLDEAVALGPVLNVLHREGKPVSYVTTGQEVPHQIEVGQCDRLASMLLGDAD